MHRGVPLLEIGVATCVLLLVGLTVFVLWGPDANRLESMAAQLEREHKRGLGEELLLWSSLVWRQVFLGIDSPEVPHGLEHLASYYDCRQMPERAEALLQRAVGILRDNYAASHTMKGLQNESHQDLIDGMNKLMSFYVHHKQYHEAARVLHQEIRILCDHDMNNPDQVRAFAVLAREVGRHVPHAEIPKMVRVKEESWQAHLMSALTWFHVQRDKTYEHNAEHGAWNLMQAHKIAAEFYFATGRYNLAEKEMIESSLVSASWKPQFNTPDADLLMLAAIKIARKDLNGAEACYKQVLANQFSTCNNSSITLEMALRDYAGLKKLCGDEKEAKNFTRQANLVARKRFQA